MFVDTQHGLRSTGTDRFAARGAPDRSELERLAAAGATLGEMAAAVDRSISTVRHWLAKWAIERTGEREAKRDPATAPRLAERTCKRHGPTEFVLENRGYYRRKRCRQERVSDWRRRVKSRLVAEAGGRCRRCGYDRCDAALHFHHLDPRQKTFALSRQGATRSFAHARAEAAKCILLCANCHAEVESGYGELSVPDAA
ncbi:MAG TPA: hypothetical protein VFQ12_03080 [Thermoleophilaceae bacterium]|nr:hypothetical protein [Thermoleophilaceae bacterium]